MFGPGSRVKVHPFSVQQEGEEFVLGRAGGAYVAVPPEAIEILENLRSGKTLAEVQEIFFESRGERPDLGDFLAGLYQRGFVEPRSLDEVISRETLSVELPRAAEIETGRVPALARALFGRAALVVYLLVILAAFAAVMVRPELVPGRSALFFPRHRTFFALLLLAFTCISIWNHELGHLLAARSVGVKSRIGISHRLWVVVAETDLSGLWSVPRQKRYLPFLAGCLVDLVSAALLVLFLFADLKYPFALPAEIRQLICAMIFIDLMRILWQGYLFLRTDFYYVIGSLTGCKNLIEDTENFLRNQLARILPSIRQVDQSAIPGREMRIVRVYSAIWLAGRLLSFGILILVILPLAAYYVRSLLEAFRRGVVEHPYAFVDAFFVTAGFLLPFLLGMTLWIKSFFTARRIPQ
jgi:putative peptide zinc metalloprotease protein